MSWSTAASESTLCAIVKPANPLPEAYRYSQITDVKRNHDDPWLPSESSFDVSRQQAPRNQSMGVPGMFFRSSAFVGYFRILLSRRLISSRGTLIAE